MRERDFFEDDDDEYDDEYDTDADIDIEMFIGDERQKQILKWLIDSPLAEPLEGGEKADFFIRQGSPVRLKDGFVVEAVSWLETEGFDESLLVEGYTLSTEFLDNARGQAMIFRKRQIVDAPFEIEALEGLLDASDNPEDIPF